jgi:hypothetical protein
MNCFQRWTAATFCWKKGKREWMEENSLRRRFQKLKSY